MPLHFEAQLSFSSPFHSTTYTRTGGFCLGENPEFQRVARQNPPVLWLAERDCSRPEQPLSATHGRQRYNTLDFAGKVVCHETAGFIGFFPPRQRRRLWKPLPRVLCPLWIPQPTGRSRPYWKPRAKGICHPFGIPARFEMSTHKWKMVCGHSFQNEIIPRASSGKKMKFWGLFHQSRSIYRIMAKAAFFAPSTACTTVLAPVTTSPAANTPGRVVM